MSWTDDRVELLKKLWADGLSASIRVVDERRGARLLALVAAIVALGADLAMLGLGGSGGAPTRGRVARRPGGLLAKAMAVA